jgi:hypothetical protein
MEILRPIVEALVLAMLDARHDLTLGRAIAAERIGDQHTRCSTLLLQELAQQALAAHCRT